MLRVVAIIGVVVTASVNSKFWKVTDNKLVFPTD